MELFQNYFCRGLKSAFIIVINRQPSADDLVYPICIPLKWTKLVFAVKIKTIRIGCN